MIREYDISDAAQLLNISKEATRKRISRKTLKAKKKNNRWIVYLDDKDVNQYVGQDERGHIQDAKDQIISMQQEQIEFLKEEMRKKDIIIMSQLERIPKQLAAPGERKGIFNRILRKKSNTVDAND